MAWLSWARVRRETGWSVPPTPATRTEFGRNDQTDPAPAGQPVGNGVFGLSMVPNASGVFGAHNNGGNGVAGSSSEGDGVVGSTGTSAKNGIVGRNDQTDPAPHSR